MGIFFFSEPPTETKSEHGGAVPHSRDEPPPPYSAESKKPYKNSQNRLDVRNIYV